MKRKLTIKLLLFFILSINTIAIADVTKNPGVLSLQEFIEKACVYDVNFQEILSDNLKLKYYKDLNLESGDFIFSVTNQYNFYTKKPESNGISNTVSLSKLFPNTGTEASASYTTNPGTAVTERSSSFLARVSQPIAQNAFGYLNRLEEEIQEIEIDVVKYQVAEAYEDYLASIISLYYEWYTDYANLKTASASLEESKKILNNIKVKKKYSIADQSDVDRISLQIIEKQENVSNLETMYNKSFDMIIQACGMKAQTIIPDFSSYTEKTIDFDTEYAEFIKSGRTYYILDLLERKGSVNVKSKSGALLPSVDLFLGYSRDGYDYSFKEPEDKVYLGLSLQYAIPQSKAKAAFEISKIEKDNTALNSESTKRKLETDLKYVFNQIKLEESLIITAEEKIKISERILKSETNNYQQARTGLTDLINAINDLETMKYNKFYHSTKLNTFRVEWLRLTDKLIFREDIIGQN